MTFHIQYVDISNEKRRLILETYSPSNFDYLCQEDNKKFPLLSEVDPYYAVDFRPGNMDNLIIELEKIKLTIEGLQEVSHVEKIISMCENCKSRKSSTIVFNPFNPLIIS